MRTSKLKPQEIAELDEMNRRETRKQGFALMPTRDRGWGTLRDIDGSRVTALWHTDREPVAYETMRRIPNGTFVLIKDGTEIILNAEDLRKFLRWA